MNVTFLRHCRVLLAATVQTLTLLSLTATAAEPDAQQTQALHALFDRQWEWSARTYPEFATYRGDNRFGDRLSDVSAGAIAARDAEVADFLAAARALQRSKLGPADRVSLDLFIDAQQRQAETAAFPAARGMTLRALGGPQTQFAELLQVMPTARADQVEQMLSRMAAFPRRMEQEMAIIRRSAEAGWMPPRDVLERVLVQIDTQLIDPDATPYHQPFKRLGSGIAPVEQQALQLRGRDAVATQVLPALQRRRALIADELLPKAPAEGALRQYPDGERVYAMLVRHRTTTNLTPAQIHAIGQRELTRLRGEMEAVMRSVKFAGSFAQFVAFINTDERFFHKSPEALLAGYRDIAKRLDA